MVSRMKGSPHVFLLAAVAFSMAASQHSPVAAQTPNLVWGGPVPQPGGGYVPSAPRRDGTDLSAPLPPADIPFQPDVSGAPEISGEPVIVRDGPATAAAIDAQPETELPADDAALIDEPSERSLYEDLMGLSQPTPDSAASEPEANLSPPEDGSQETLPEAPAALSPPHVVARVPEPSGEIREPAPRRSPAEHAKPPGRRTAALGAPEPFAMPGARVPGRGALSDQTPGGYAVLPRGEAACRNALRAKGVRFTELSPISRGRSCGIAHPIRVTQIASGVAMKPAATLNCAAAARISGWVEEEVKPAARWRLWKSPAAVLNASSYRCSVIAGSRTVSEHATGNALDVRGFVFTDGSVFDVEKKGIFSFREKGFQQTIRHSACQYFGTVLGPGYNRAHRDHLHLDAKNRRRMVCK